MHFNKAFTLSSLLLLSIFALSGCGGGKETEEAKPRAISVSGTATGTIIGEKIQLNASLQYTDTSSELITPKVNWESENTDVATIDENASVTCMTEGTTKIVASFESFTTEFSISCSDAPYIAEIKFFPASAEIDEGSELAIRADAILSDGEIAENVSFTWSIPEDKSEIASIDPKTGRLTGIKYGNTTVNVTVNTGNTETIVNLSDDQQWPQITVAPVTDHISLAPPGYDENNPPVTDFELNLDLGETARIIVLEHKTDGKPPTDISQKITKWAYQNSSVAIVNRGLVSSRSIGSTTIDIGAYNGFKSSNIVTVNVELPLELFVTQETGGQIVFEWRDKFSSPEYRILRRPVSTGVIEEPIYVSGLTYTELTSSVSETYEYTIGYQLPDDTFSDDNIPDDQKKWILIKPSFTEWQVKNSLPPRAYASSVIVGDNIYVFGGEITNTDNSKTTSNEVWQYSTSTHHWDLRGNMPSAVKNASACVVNGKYVFLFGGLNNEGTATNQILTHNLETNDWNISTTFLGTAISDMSCSSNDSTIYVSGGINSTAAISDKIYSFTTDATTITPSTTFDLSTPRYKHDSIMHNGLLYIAGGKTSLDPKATRSVEMLDPLAPPAFSIAHLDTARYDLKMSLIGNSIYALGGHDNLNEDLITDVEFYDPTDSNSTWKPSSSMPFANAGFVAEYSDTYNSLFLFGGTDLALTQGNGTGKPHQMTYNLNTLTWNPLLSPKDIIFQSASGHIGDNIYLIGGRDIEKTDSVSFKSEATNVTQQYNATENTWVSENSGPGPLNTERVDTATVSTGSLIFAIGGIDKNEQTLSSIEVLGTTTSPNSWQIWSESLAYARAGACATYHEDRDEFNRLHRYIYIFGGINNGTFVDVIERLNLDTKKMSIADGTFKTPRAGLSCVTVRDTIYLVGGYDKTPLKEAKDTVESYFTKTEKINTELMPLKNSGRIKPALSAYNDRIYVFGGISDDPVNRSAILETQIYDILNNQWEVSNELPLTTPSNNPYSAVIGNRIHLISPNQVLEYDADGNLLGLSYSNSIHVTK